MIRATIERSRIEAMVCTGGQYKFEQYNDEILLGDISFVVFEKNLNDTAIVSDNVGRTVDYNRGFGGMNLVLGSNVFNTAVLNTSKPDPEHSVKVTDEIQIVLH